MEVPPQTRPTTRDPVWSRVVACPGLRAYLGVGAAVVLATALRLVGVGDHLPALASGDEQALVSRSKTVLAGGLPTAYDWPTGAMQLLAALMRVGDVLHPGLVQSQQAWYLAGRLMSVASGTTMVLLGALLAARLTRPLESLRSGAGALAAVLAAAVLAVAYTSVVASRTGHPEILQDTAVLAAVLLTLRMDRSGQSRDALAAGVLAGTAGGLKYVGGSVLVVVLVAALTRGPRRRRLTLAGTALAGALAALVVLLPALLVDRTALLAGLSEQVLHSSNGHVGFDSPDLALGYHLTRSLPGSIGLPLAVAVVLAVPFAALRGPRPRRLAALAVLVTVLPVGVSHLVFPRYVLLVLPTAVALTCAVLVDLVATRRLPRPAARVPGAAVLTVAALAALVPVALDDVRFVAASRARDTREDAAAFVATLSGRVLVENLAVAGLPVEPGRTPSPGEVPDVVAVGGVPQIADLAGCDCYVVSSSFMEERFRREPQRYAQEVGAYDLLRRTGTVVRRFEPDGRFGYRWEALPGYGSGDLPLGGPRTAGPVVTVFHVP